MKYIEKNKEKKKYDLITKIIDVIMIAIVLSSIIYGFYVQNKSENERIQKCNHICSDINLTNMNNYTCYSNEPVRKYYTIMWDNNKECYLREIMK